MNTGDEIRKLAVCAEHIPQEMFWAYEVIRKSGMYNMVCFHPVVGRYADDMDECLSIMDDIYIRLCCINNVELPNPKYVHMTKNHVRAIQQCYSMLYECYGVNIPKEISEIKIKKTTKFSY